MQSDAHTTVGGYMLGGRGRSELALGDVEAARHSYERAITIRTARFGSDHAATREARERLAGMTR